MFRKEWPVLMVDDDPDARAVSKLAMRDFRVDGVPLKLNLLANVERYAYPEGAGGEVEISLAAVNEGREPRFVLRVRDAGVGIAPNDLARVFDPFFTTGRGRGGTGLGLTIVHNIVTSALKGGISIASTPGRGTEVTVTIPQTIRDGNAT